VSLRTNAYASLLHKALVARQGPDGFVSSSGRMADREASRFVMGRWRWSLHRLCAVQTSSHSLLQAVRPRRDIAVIFWQVLIWPNTGSTVCPRSRLREGVSVGGDSLVVGRRFGLQRPGRLTWPSTQPYCATT
jgi:hypothetical protein